MGQEEQTGLGSRVRGRKELASPAEGRLRKGGRVGVCAVGAAHGHGTDERSVH